MDPLEFLRSEDQVEILTMQAIAINVAEVRAKQMGSGS
jgi:hypothetical protein